MNTLKENAIKFLYAIDCYLLYVLSGVVSSLLVVAYYSLSAAWNIGGLGARVDATSFSEYISELLSGKASAALLISYVLVLVVTALVFLFRKSKMSAYTGLSYTRPLSLVGSVVLGVVLNLLVSEFVPVTGTEPVKVNIILVLCVILGPFVEELMFRGVLLKMFGSAVGVVFSILITSLLFAVSHGNLVQAGYTFGLGLVLGLVRYKSTSLWSAIALHTAFNISGAVSAFYTFDFAPAETVFLAVLAAASIILACTGGRKYEPKKRA